MRRAAGLARAVPSSVQHGMQRRLSKLAAAAESKASRPTAPKAAAGSASAPSAEHGFWASAWDKPAVEVGWRRTPPEYHAAQVENVCSLLKPSDIKRVFVPLCGDSPAVKLFAERGHDVIGVEIVSSAGALRGQPWSLTCVVVAGAQWSFC